MTDAEAASGRADRPLAALAAACSAALFAPLLVPLVTGRVFVYNDLLWFHLPLRHLYQQALAAGDTVLWTPSIFAGLYLHGEGQGGFFHPFHQLLYRLLPLGAAFNVELIANYPIAFGGMFCFLRRLRCSQAAALFGAMLFAFSGFNLLHHHHVNMVAVVAHLPLLLTAADVLIAADSRRARTLAFAAVALIVGSGILLGFPQAVWWNAVTLAAFAFYRAAESRRWRHLAVCAGAAAAGILLGAIQLLPTAEFAAHSTRMEVSPEFALTYAMHPYNLLQLWSPYFFARGAYSATDFMWFHDFGIYSGAILPIALIWVWLRRDALRQRRRLVTALTAFAALMLILALGRYGGVAVLLSHLPVLQSLRAPVRYIVLVQFALAILAAITLDDLLAIASRRSAPPAGRMAALWVPAALGIVTTIALNTGLLGFGRHTFAPAVSAAPGVAIVLAVTLLVYLAGRGRQWPIVALVVLTAIDLAAWGTRFIYREPSRTIRELTERVPPPPDDPAETYASAPARGPYRPNVLVLRGYRLTSGYVALFPATTHPLNSDIAQRLSGTRWSFAQDGTRHPAAGWVERARLLDEHGRATAGSARVIVDRPGLLVVDVAAPDRSILALTERFHNGWSANDGTALATVRVEADFLGCVVERGARRVTLRFMPASFVYGAWTSGLAAVLLAGVVILRLT
jgi:hypothetical protein